MGKDKKLYAAFMDLEKAHDRVDREAFWNVLYIYVVGGQLLKGIQAFYREANACVRVAQGQTKREYKKARYSLLLTAKEWSKGRLISVAEVS